MNDYYCLIARSRRDNRIYSIPLCQNDYLGNGNYIGSRFLPLAAIDIFTMHFSDEEHLSSYLKESMLIPKDENADIFIGHKYRYKNIDQLKIQEIVYGVKKDRVEELTSIAAAEMSHEDERNIKGHVLDKFISKLRSNRLYFTVIREAGFCYGMRQQIIDAFVEIENMKTSPYQVKYRHPNFYKQYGLFRGIILSLNMFDNIKVPKGSSYPAFHNKYFSDKMKDRTAIKPKIMYYCDQSIDLYQNDMFGNPFGDDVYMEERKMVPLSYPWDEKKDEKVVLEPLEDKRDNSKKDDTTPKNRTLYVQNVLFGLDHHVFVENENGSYVFNLSCVESGTPLDDVRILTNSIESSLARALFFHSLHSETMALELSNFKYASLGIQEEVVAYENDISRLLQNKKRFEKAYTWCRTYEKMIGRGQKGGEGRKNTI